MTWPFSRWLFVTVPAFVISGVLLALTVRSLLRTLAGAAVFALSLQQSQTFRLAEPGAYDLYLEGRQGTMDFAGLETTAFSPTGRCVAR